MIKLRVTLFLIIVFICILITGCGNAQHQPDALQQEFETRGGIRITLEPQNKGLTVDELNSVKTILGNRLTDFGFLKKIITTDASGNIIVDLINDNDKVNLSNVQSKIDFLSMKGLLTVQEIDESKVDEHGDYLPTGKIIFDGSKIIEAQVFEDYDHGAYKITVGLNTEGATDLREATGRLIGKKIGIFMDNTLLVSPNVQDGIDNGKLDIPGRFSNEEALNYCTIIKSEVLPTELINKSILVVSPK